MRHVARLTLSVGLILSLTLLASVNPVTADEEDVETLALIWERNDGHNATAWSVRWSPDGSMISGTFFDNTTVIWNSTTGKRIMKLGSHANSTSERGTRCDGNQSCTIATHFPTRVSAWSPNGRHLVIGGDDTFIWVFNTSDWHLEKVLSGHLGSVLTLDFSPDGRFLASGSGTDKVMMHNIPENMVKIWDFESGVAISNLTGHTDGVLEVKWSKNGSKLVSASDDKTLKMWDTSSWVNIFNMTGHAGGVLSVDWSTNEMELASGSRDYKIRIWDTLNGTMKDVWQAPNCVRSVDYHQNGELIVSSGVSEVMIMIRNATSGTILRTLDENRGPTGPVGVIMSTRWSPDGKRLAAASGKEMTIRVYGFGLATPPIPPLIPEWMLGVAVFLTVLVAATWVTIVWMIGCARKQERR